jgi:hypothetical protein
MLQFSPLVVSTKYHQVCQMMSVDNAISVCLWFFQLSLSASHQQHTPTLLCVCV